MARVRRVYVCRSCGYQSPAWQGKCSSCGEWNSFDEEVVEKSSGLESPGSDRIAPVRALAVASEVPVVSPSGIRELDRVLGTGFVSGSAVLLGGEPGIGKSTLGLQVARNLAAQGMPVLYISGEESAPQLLLRAQRLGVVPESLWIYTGSELGDIMRHIQQLQPEFVVLDSIQVVSDRVIPASPGTVSQVRHCASELIGLMKSLQKTLLIIGHITKEGQLAGPKLLEHMVDVILYFEGERSQHYRLLRCFKNRFGRADDVGIFEMKSEGLSEVLQPSHLFFNGLSVTAGSVAAPVMEGARSLVVEVQALAVDTGYGMGKRTFLGVDPNRANLVIAVMDKHLRLKLFSKDIFITIIGGIRVAEPALDLCIGLSVLSSLYEQVMSQKAGILGELSLTGDLRPVPFVEKRMKELEAMGFSHCVLPETNRRNFPKVGSVEPVFVRTIADAARWLVQAK